MRRLPSLMITLMAVAIVTAFLTSCDQRMVYGHFEHTPVAGWERDDTLSFQIAPLRIPGRYAEEICLRMNESYPFTSLSLVIEQHLFPGNRVHTDTLHCRLCNEKGLMNGHGVSSYQYKYKLKLIDLRPNDSLSIRIRHAMKREILPGIADIGVILESEE